MLFSAFSEFGDWGFIEDDPPSARIFEDMLRNYGGAENYSDDFDSVFQARVYAFAMAFGRAYGAATRAGNQFDPYNAVELLPCLEFEVGRTPEPGETIEERQRQVAALLKIPRGARSTNVEAVLGEALGEHFVAYLPTPKADAVHAPADPEDTGAFPMPGDDRAVYRLVDGCGIGTATLTVEHVAGTGLLSVGQVVVLDVADYGRMEAVAVEAMLSPTQMTVTTTHPHDPGQLFGNHRQPNQVSTRRHNAIKVTTEAALDPRLRRIAQRTAERLLRGVSTWSLIDDSGPFRVGQGLIGITPIGDV